MKIQHSLNFNEVLLLVQLCGHRQGVVVEGQPGIGKTSIGRVLSAKLALPYTEFDCATKIDGGNISIPWMANGKYDDIPNAVFASACDEPSIICFDEIGKANKAVIAAITPILRDRKVLGRRLHDKTIVYATSNNRSDNVGDNIPAHIWNAVTSVQMRNPTAEEWIHGFALKNNVPAELVAWVSQNPHCFAHYSDYGSDTKANSLIFDPRVPDRRAYVSPRSLARAAIFLEQKSMLERPMLEQALSGTLGPTAAHDIVNFADLAAKLPLYDAVIANPKTIAVPDRGPGQILSILSVANRACADTSDAMKAVVSYAQRMEEEVQAMFVNYIYSGPYQHKWSLNNRGFTDMCHNLINIIA